MTANSDSNVAPWRSLLPALAAVAKAGVAAPLADAGSLAGADADAACALYRCPVDHEPFDVEPAQSAERFAVFNVLRPSTIQQEVFGVVIELFDFRQRLHFFLAQHGVVKNARVQRRRGNEANDRLTRQRVADRRVERKGLIGLRHCELAGQDGDQGDGKNMRQHAEHVEPAHASPIGRSAFLGLIPNYFGEKFRLRATDG